MHPITIIVHWFVSYLHSIALQLHYNCITNAFLILATFALYFHGRKRAICIIIALPMHSICMKMHLKCTINAALFLFALQLYCIFIVTKSKNALYLHYNCIEIALQLHLFKSNPKFNASTMHLQCKYNANCNANI